MRTRLLSLPRRAWRVVRALGLRLGLAGLMVLPAAALAQTAPGGPGTAPQTEAAAVPGRILTLDLTRDANDIWDRIRRGFSMPELDSERVLELQGFYLNHPNFLRQVFARGGRYLYYIVDELERRGMPTELALLPMVESSYNPMALSRARASGLWQFIPSTGKQYNLIQDDVVDERRDVIASTNAALDYLQYIYEMHGDWHLALASYNWGEGSVQRALKRNAEAGLPLEYAHLRMPEETRNYVPRLQAIKNIVSEPELFHFELPFVANELYFTTVEAPPGVDLAEAARISGLPLDEFLALNPSFKRAVTTRPGQTLVVPADRVSQLQDGMAELVASGQTGLRLSSLSAPVLGKPADKAGVKLRVDDRAGSTAKKTGTNKAAAKNAGTKTAPAKNTGTRNAPAKSTGPTNAATKNPPAKSATARNAAAKPAGSNPAAPRKADGKATAAAAKPAAKAPGAKPAGANAGAKPAGAPAPAPKSGAKAASAPKPGTQAAPAQATKPAR